MSSPSPVPAPATAREDVRFPSGAADCAAWLYRPPGDAPAAGTPLVILGHGLGATREMGLDAYAERFAAAGIAALAFTYRHFGDSGGEPRQLLSIPAQREDWHAALAYARTLSGIDPARIAIWGSSFGGGHVLAVAADDPQVAAVVSQVPFTSGLASSLALGPISSLRSLPRILADLLARVLGHAPVLIALSGPPRSAALMTAPDAVAGVDDLVPDDVPYVNGVAARIGLQLMLDHPGKAVERIEAPILFSVSADDSVAPTKPTLKYAAKAKRGEVKTYDAGHFAVYLGEPFEQVVADQTAFLAQHLLED